MWEIRETYGDRMAERVPVKYGDPELQEAYECGWADHEEMSDERVHERIGMREYPADDRMGYRGGRYPMGERRMRDYRGRYM